MKQKNIVYFCMTMLYFLTLVQYFKKEDWHFYAFMTFFMLIEYCTLLIVEAIEKTNK